MTGFLKGLAVSQVDEVLVMDGKIFGEKQLQEILKDVKPWEKVKKKRGKK